MRAPAVQHTKQLFLLKIPYALLLLHLADFSEVSDRTS